MNRFSAAILYAYNGDLDKFHELSSQSLASFTETDDPNDALEIAEACLVAPPHEAHLMAASKLVDKTYTLNLRSNDIPWAQLAKALCEHRRGNGQAAIDWANWSLAKSAGFTVRKALCLGVLAMAHAQLQDRDAAHEAEIELAQMIQENSPFHIGTAPGLGWRYWLIRELFLREIRQARTDAEQ